jgi:uncharacterized protein (TIGR03067 family)
VSIGILSLALLISVDPDKGTTDLDKLQGEWTMSALEIQEKSVPQNKLDGTKLTIKDDTYTVTTKGSTYKVTFKLDPSKNPKTIDMYFPDEPNAPKVIKGIYKIEGDSFVMCRPQASEGDRPSDFFTSKTNDFFVVTWKKSTPR